MSNWQLPIAFYGAALATGHLVWAIWRHHRQKGRLLLNWCMSRGTNPNGEGTYLAAWLGIVNAGDKPVYLGAVKCGMHDGDYFFAPNCNGPGKKFEPGEWSSETLSAELLLNNNVTSVWAEDSVYNKYYLKTRDFKKMLQALQNERARLNSIGMYDDPKVLLSGSHGMY